MRYVLCASWLWITAGSMLTVSAVPVVQEDLKERVKSSISRGVDYLKRTQLRGGFWDYQGQIDPKSHQVLGCAALCGIALMECDVPVTDSHVQATAQMVRTGLNGSHANYNYGLCLCLVFLDRLHKNERLDHRDVGTIKQIAWMIVNGQSSDGGWTYTLSRGASSDNSNTQFAIVALWIARKYAMNDKPLQQAIEKALQHTDKKFRTMQRSDGGWGYDATNIQVALEATGTMTCAGLLGIALHAGARQQHEAVFAGEGAAGATGSFFDRLNNDQHVAKARKFLIHSFQEYLLGASKHGHTSYFFWSLERVATLYKWKYLDEDKKIDWYVQGCEYVMRLQDQQKGSWSVDFQQGPAVDTSFMLLFLAKSQLLSPLYEAEFRGDQGGELAGNKPLPRKEKKPEAPKDHAQRAREWGIQLQSAVGIERTRLLDELRDAPLGDVGKHYTNALVKAIEQLKPGPVQELAREALAGRVQQMPQKDMLSYVNGDEPELRLAAAVALRHKDEGETAATLISLLRDRDEAVAKAALESLHAISQQDFGKSVEKWNRWLANRSRKP